MAAQLASEITPMLDLQHERLTLHHHGYRLWDLSLSLSGAIAVSGRNHSGRTFIDLYFGRNSRGTLKRFYSKEFEKCSNYLHRHVSFLEYNGRELLVTCIGNIIEIFDTKIASEVLRSRRVDGEIWCLAVREGEVFIGLRYSQKMIVFNDNLKEKKKVILKEVKHGDYPLDLQVIKDTVFLCTSNGRALSLTASDGSLLAEYANTTGKYDFAHRIAVSKELGLVAVVWGGDQIIVYSFNDSKSLLVCDVDSDILRIIIADRSKVMITGNYKHNTGEMKMYDLARLFSYDHMKTFLVSEMKTEDCVELMALFKLDQDHSDLILKSDTPMKNLFLCLEERGDIEASGVDILADALMNISPSCYNVIDIYRKVRHQADYDQAKSTIKKLTRQMKGKEEAWEDERQKLKNEVKELEVSRIRSAAKIGDMEKKIQTGTAEIERLKRELDQTKHERDVIRSELTKCQLDIAKESRALKEVLNQRKQAILEEQTIVSEDKPVMLDGASFVKPNENVETEASVLAAAFGRLLVGIADNLTLDQTLQLAMLFNLPPSFNDALCRVSQYQSPAMKFLEEIRDRNLINMYDVDNLQKTSVILQLEMINQLLLEPYQQKVEKCLREMHKTKEILSWEDVATFRNKMEQPGLPHTEEGTIRLGKSSGEQLDCSTQTESIAQHVVTEIVDRATHLRVKHSHACYKEHNIGKEGGVIHQGAASLCIPPEALLQSHVIGFTVMHEAPIPLPREVDEARMTPLIKLEPLGLKLRKPIKLTIPHTALISNLDNHDVVIFSGQMSASTERLSDPDTITWTEEKSLPTELREKTVAVDIQCLSFLSASLLSQTKQPPHFIIRAVTFVDRVRNADDDIIVTVCFCKDNELEYSMLLSDYKTKLPLEQYETVHIRRNSGSKAKDGGELRLALSSLNTTYLLASQQEVKNVAVSHLYGASRVFHHFRLMKNRDIDHDEVYASLTISQAEKKVAEMFLKARMKDFVITCRTEERLMKPLFPAYEELKANISAMLETRHCSKLAHYFELTPEERDRIENDSSPGRILMKILDEREKIMSHKMIDLFEGLKACHLDKIARKVSEYIKENSGETQQEERLHEKTKIKKVQNQQVSGSLSSKIEIPGDVRRYLIAISVHKLLTQFDVWRLPYHVDYWK